MMKMVSADLIKAPPKHFLATYFFDELSDESNAGSSPEINE